MAFGRDHARQFARHVADLIAAGQLHALRHAHEVHRIVGGLPHKVDRDVIVLAPRPDDQHLVMVAVVIAPQQVDLGFARGAFLIARAVDALGVVGVQFVKRFDGWHGFPLTRITGYPE
jgi:hypothetical protein